METRAGSGQDKLREIQGANLCKCWEIVRDVAYYNLSSRMYLGLQDNK